MSFGLPSGGAGYPISPYGPNPAINPYGHSLGGGNGLNLGLVNVNPLLSLQVSKGEDGEKVVKPWVNLHVTPNHLLVDKFGYLIHKLKAPHYEHYGHPPAYYHQHNHFHTAPVHSYPPKPYYPQRPPYSSYYAPSYHGYNSLDYGPPVHDDEEDYDSGYGFYRSVNVTDDTVDQYKRTSYPEAEGKSGTVVFPNDRSLVRKRREAQEEGGYFSQVNIWTTFGRRNCQN